MKGDSIYFESDVQQTQIKKRKEETMKKFTLLVLLAFMAFILSAPSTPVNLRTPRAEIYYDMNSFYKARKDMYPDNTENDPPFIPTSTKKRTSYSNTSHPASRRGKRLSVFEF